ncbi:MAG: hypothetical protein AAFP89_22625 [Bacteroidota bacterium]
MMQKTTYFQSFRTLILMGLVAFMGMIQAQEVDLDLLKNMKARSIGPAGMSGRVAAIDAVVAEPDIIYAGTASGGLWKTENGGISWTALFDSQKVTSIGAISIYQKNPNVVWVGTGEGNPRNSQTSGYGVYRSLDGGRSWKCMGLENTRNIHRIFVHPEDPNTVYVGAQGVAWGESTDRGLYRTTDGGETWEKVLYINETTGVGDMVIDPQNPNKLMVAMWQFRRWPWFFKSGGEGSGLYISYDGGDSFEEITAKNGLPKGELGRIGLAIAPSNTKRVYALVESKKNAFYRSDDGGHNWTMVNNKTEIGVRPFYFWDIFVDPVNENRIYSIYSMVSMSEDAGKSFKVIIPYSGVHPDHHAWWIHPEDPNYIIEGNDGGMAISRDRAKSWRFIENLPLAQFYHINVDNEIPYNVYGGMQDNGSWRGPAYVWRYGGIRNTYWEELSFGDGFDVVPVPEDARFGYSMAQGGSLVKYDYETGNTKFIKPMHPDGERLRFNWNAAIAQDPFDQNTVYYGSQFVHKSTDRGENWTMISPDLTTNDPEKQKQMESGGLTYDVTQAENFTTILAIAPSPLDRNVMWVGTDDGNLQLTQDGGKSWTNLSDRLPDFPQNGWIPQIHPSATEAGEAYVVVNNYRQNDWKPYLYRTRNFGKKWERLVDETKVEGHCLSVVQDPKEKNLIFLGTEYGLYISFDEGVNWQKWTHGFPTASTIDMKIQPREQDLVIGTFGRAAFVLDDIRPLRALARDQKSVMDASLVAFEAPDAYMVDFRQAKGIRFDADGMYRGENKRGGALISFMWNPKEMKKDKKEEGDKEEMKKGKGKGNKAKIEIVDGSGDVIRTLMTKVDTGLNRVTWRLDSKGVGSWRRANDSDREPGGGPIMPGTYTVRISYGDAMDSTSVNVLTDPRKTYNKDNWEAQVALEKEYIKYGLAAKKAYMQVKDAEKSLGQIKKVMAMQGDMPDSVKKDMGDYVKSMKKELKRLDLMYRSDPDKQGIVRSPDNLGAIGGMAGRYLSEYYHPVNETQKIAMEMYKQKVEEVLKEVNAFFEKDWPTFKQEVEKVEMPLFKQTEAIEIE